MTISTSTTSGCATTATAAATRRRASARCARRASRSTSGRADVDRRRTAAASSSTGTSAAGTAARIDARLAARSTPTRPTARRWRRRRTTSHASSSRPAPWLVAAAARSLPRGRVREYGAVVVRGAGTDTEAPDRGASRAAGCACIATHFGRIEDLRTDNTTNAEHRPARLHRRRGRSAHRSAVPRRAAALPDAALHAAGGRGWREPARRRRVKRRAICAASTRTPTRC